nr:alpha/beta hydrolase [uncultured Actinoplanes sp.]
MRARQHSGPPGSFEKLSRDLLGRSFPDGDPGSLDHEAGRVAAEVQRNLHSDGFSKVTGEPPGSEKPPLPGRFAIIAGFAGALAGAAAGWELLRYSSFFALLLAAGLTGLFSLVIYWYLLRRKQLTGVVEGVIQIPQGMPTDLEAGRSLPHGSLLHYLEAKRESDELVIFVHGLGLGATDFQTYLAESKYHSIALTLYGFNADEKDDEDYPPISLETHAQLFAAALQKLQNQYPGKRLSLVGFSVGADIILFLSQLAASYLTGVRIHRVLLLNPNINRTTTTISSRMAKLDDDRLLEQLVELLRSAKDVDELRWLCEYVYKTTSKDIAQVRRHAQDISDLWQENGTDQFIEYVADLTKIAGGIYVVLAADKRGLLEELRDRAYDSGINVDHFSLSASGHFELLDPSFLRRQLEVLL